MSPKSRTAVDLHVGIRLRRQRRALNMDPDDLDRAIGEPPGTVARFEQGKPIGAASLYRLGRALDVPPSFFFEGLPDPPVVEGVAPPDAALAAEGARLVRAYSAVSDVQARRDFLRLVQSIAADETGRHDAPRATPGAPNGAAPGLAAIGAVLARHGLVCRGAFHPRPEDGVPGACGTLVLIGNVGDAMWKAFARRRRGGDHSLDAWSRRVLGRAARRFGALALFPFEGPPYYPFQRWAQRAEAVYPSLMGPLIHPDYGLWHAYRGAFAFPGVLALGAPDRRPSPCDACPDRPCLSACPVGALAVGAYKVGACTSHLLSADGGDCMDRHCRARRACPVGGDHVYGAAQARFHMEQFVAARRRHGDV